MKAWLSISVLQFMAEGPKMMINCFPAATHKVIVVNGDFPNDSIAAR